MISALIAGVYLPISMSASMMRKPAHPSSAETPISATDVRMSRSRKPFLRLHLSMNIFTQTTSQNMNATRMTIIITVTLIFSRLRRKYMR